MGKSKVFFKDAAIQMLDEKRHDLLLKSVQVLQKYVRRYRAMALLQAEIAKREEAARKKREEEERKKREAEEKKRKAEEEKRKLEEEKQKKEEEERLRKAEEERRKKEQSESLRKRAATKSKSLKVTSLAQDIGVSEAEYQRLLEEEMAKELEREMELEMEREMERELARQMAEAEGEVVPPLREIYDRPKSIRKETMSARKISAVGRKAALSIAQRARRRTIISDNEDSPPAPTAPSNSSAPRDEKKPSWEDYEEFDYGKYGITIGKPKYSDEEFGQLLDEVFGSVMGEGEETFQEEDQHQHDFDETLEASLDPEVVPVVLPSMNADLDALVDEIVGPLPVAIPAAPEDDTKELPVASAEAPLNPLETTVVDATPFEVLFLSSPYSPSVVALHVVLWLTFWLHLVAI